MLFLLFFLSPGFTIATQVHDAQVLEDSYERISYTIASGKYENSKYISSHKITDGSFDYEGSNSKKTILLVMLSQIIPSTGFHKNQAHPVFIIK